MEYIVPALRLPVTGSASFDFAGGELTSDGGLLIVAELAARLGVRERLAACLPHHPLRIHDDDGIAWAKALSLACGHRADDDLTALRDDPAFAHLCGPLPSQETVSRRLSAMGWDDVSALQSALDGLFGRVCALDGATEAVVDVDTTLLPTCGSQEGACWNAHYSEVGYHPIVATDTLRRDVVGFGLRPGSQYCSKDAGAFCSAVLDRMLGRMPPAAVLFLRGDAGFAAPEVYRACEERGVRYAVRLKENAVLQELAGPVASLLVPGAPGTVTGEFAYRAGSWERERRVVFEAEMADGEMVPRLTFVVTDMASLPSRVLAFYRKRGAMELVIGDLKGFLGGATPHRSMAANAYRCLLGVLAYQLVNWLRRLCLSGDDALMRPPAVVAAFVKVAARRVSHAGSVLFRFPTSYPRKRAVYRALQRLSGMAA